MRKSSSAIGMSMASIIAILMSYSLVKHTMSLNPFFSRPFSPSVRASLSKNVEPKPDSVNFLQALASGTISLLPLKRATIPLRPLQKSTAFDRIPSDVDSTDKKTSGFGTISLFSSKKSTARAKNPNIAEFKQEPIFFQKLSGFGSIPLQPIQKSTASERIDSTNSEYIRKALGGGFGSISLRPPQKSTANDGNVDRTELKLASVNAQRPLGSASIPPVPLKKVEPKPDSEYFKKALGLGTISLRPPQKSSASDVRSNRSFMKNIVPTLKDWIYNIDGTVTGTIFDSEKFRDGTYITTSPVKGLMKPGSVVVSIAGNKYRLM